MSKLVSIVMPAYNAATTIEESIDSVLSQTYTNWELLIVDDCSTDETPEIISNYANTDERIKYFKTPENSRVSGARNLAIKEAQGKFLAFLDSDDLWEPKKLEVQINAMKKNNSHMSCTSYQVIDVDSNQVNKLMIVPSKIPYSLLLKGSKVGCLTVVIDLDKVDKEDVFMKNIGHEDYVTWLKISKKYGPIDGIKENLARYRVFEGSLSGNKKRAIGWQYKIYREICNFDVIKSLYYLFHYGINAITKYKPL